MRWVSLGAGRLAVAHQGHDEAVVLLTEATEIARVLDERGILACASITSGSTACLRGTSTPQPLA